MPTRRAVLASGALLAASLASARAQPVRDALRVAWRDAVADLNPYRNQLRTGLVLAHHIWDCLVDRDPQSLQIRPLLATAWSQPDETSLLFTLRGGVRFHDGTAFGADDVVATVQAVVAGDVAVPGLFTWLAGAEAVDDLHVRLIFHQPFPAALDYLAMVLPILPRATHPGDAVGTGPYRVAAREGTGLQLERFEDYFPDGPKGRPPIACIVIRVVDDEQAPFTELLSDAADWIWQLGPDQFDALQHQPGLTAVRTDSMRLGYLSMDAAGNSGADGPFTRLKVRQAVLHALDRPAIGKRLGSVATRVPDTPCYPTQFGCDAAAAVRYPYDPTRAKALLADAGYPQGFATELVSYVLPEDGQAVRGYLQAVGIDANLAQLSTNEAVARLTDGRAPLFLGNWGSYSINDVAAILPQFFGGGPLDQARMPEIQALLVQAGRSGDADRRRGLYSQAIRMITEQALWTPTHSYAAVYGFNRALNFKPFPDELPRFYLASWR